MSLRQISAVSFAMSILSATPVFAQTCQTVVAFGNGIHVDKDEAEWSLRILRSELNLALVARGRAPLSAECFLLSWARNSWADIVEAAGQLTNEDPSTLRNWVFGIDIAPSTVEQLLIDDLLNSPFDALFPQAVQDLAAHVAAYRSVLNGSSKVVLVAHSQGNFFANDAYEVLSGTPPQVQPTSFKIIPVATPAQGSPTGVLHTTLFGDVILWIASQPANTDAAGTPCIPNPLAPGAPPLPGFNGRKCHSFRTSYILPGTSSRTRILNEIMVAMPSGLSPGIHQVTNTQVGGFPGQPIGISQDGSGIALLTGNSVSSISADGRNLVRISPDTLNVIRADFGATKGVFVACDNPCGSFGDVYTINYDGSGLTKLTDDSISSSATYASLNISDDGTKAFYSKSVSTGGVRWFLSNTDGSGSIELSLPTFLVGPQSLNNDGTQLGLVYRNSADGNNILAVLDIGQAAIRDVFLVQGNFRADVDLSGDGQAMAFAGSLSFSGNSVSRVPTNGSPSQTLDSSTTHVLDNVSIDFDGSTICYTSSNSTQNIFCAGPGNVLTNVTNITTSGPVANSPLISSDGRVVVFISNADLDLGKNSDLGVEIFVSVLR